MGVMRCVVVTRLWEGRRSGQSQTRGDGLVKARQSLNYLRHSIWGATTAVKSVAYKSLVIPLLEYACQVWNPHTARDKSVLEAAQRPAAKWACGSRWDPSSRRWNKSSGECIDTRTGPPLLNVVIICQCLH